MKGFVQDIEDLAVKNDEFRRVLYTATHCQLVVMALKPKEEIGVEVHTLDQFFRVEAGTGEAILDGVRTAIRAGNRDISLTPCGKSSRGFGVPPPESCQRCKDSDQGDVG